MSQLIPSIFRRDNWTVESLRGERVIWKGFMLSNCDVIINGFEFPDGYDGLEIIGFGLTLDPYVTFEKPRNHLWTPESIQRIDEPIKILSGNPWQLRFYVSKATRFKCIIKGDMKSNSLLENLSLSRVLPKTENKDLPRYCKDIWESEPTEIKSYEPYIVEAVLEE